MYIWVLAHKYLHLIEFLRRLHPNSATDLATSAPVSGVLEHWAILVQMVWGFACFLA